jgi:hypothetical protein
MKYILNPDFMYRFLLPNNYSIPKLKNINIDFRLSFNTFDSLSTVTFKMINILESIYPKRALAMKKVVKLSYNRKRIQSTLYLRLDGTEVFTFLSYMHRKPNKSVAHMYPLTIRKQMISPTFLAPYNYNITQRLTMHHVFQNNRFFVKYLFFALFN